MTSPNWPLLDYALCFSAGPNQPPTQPNWASVTSRTEGNYTLTRGKTYELDQVQPGELQGLTLRNDDGAFDPTNTSSPFYPYVLPYRMFRLRAQYPATVNLLTQNQATAGQTTPLPAPVEQPILPGPIPATANVTSGWPATIVANPSAFVGDQVFATTVPASQNAANPQVIAVAGASVTPGQAYSGQIEACCRTSGANPTVQARIQFFTAAGTSLGYFGTSTPVALVGASGTSWTEITVTNAVAPAAAAGMALVLTEATPGPASAHTIQTSGIQLEAAASCSPFTTPGIWYPMFLGYVERWPQSWTSGGNYGVVTLDIVDYFAFLAQRPMQDPFTMDLLALNPNFCYPLNEQSGSLTFNDATNNRPPIQVTPLATAGTLSSGADLQSADNAPPGQNDPNLPLTGAFLGGSGPVVALTAPSSISNASAINLGALVVPANPASGLVGPPATAWTRIVAARVTGYPGNELFSTLWQYFSDISGFILQFTDGVEGSIPAYELNMQILGNAAIGGAYEGPVSYGLPAYGTGTPPSETIYDSDWHLFGFSMSADGTTLTMSYDDQFASAVLRSSSGTLNPGPRPSQLARDIVGGSVSSEIATGGIYPVGDNWVGDVAYVAELPFAVSANQWADLNLSWRNAWGGYNPVTDVAETSDTRYARILGWVGYVGPTSIQPGSSVDYGPATDINGGTDATYALDALQNVVSSEAGEHFVDAAGTITFQARTNRYNPAPAATFGEAAGETPYASPVLDFDPTLVGNQIEVDAQFGNAAFFATDPVSVADFGDIGIQQTVNSLDPDEMQGGAEYLLYTNSQPLPRLEQLPVDVGSNPALWPTVLGLELGRGVTVNRRPSNAPEISQVGYVEQIVWTIADDRTVSCSLQISSAARHYFAEFDSPAYGAFDQSLIFGY